MGKFAQISWASPKKLSHTEGCLLALCLRMIGRVVDRKGASIQDMMGDPMPTTLRKDMVDKLAPVFAFLLNKAMAGNVTDEIELLGMAADVDCAEYQRYTAAHAGDVSRAKKLLNSLCVGGDSLGFRAVG